MDVNLHLSPNDECIGRVSRISKETVFLSIRQGVYVNEFTLFGSSAQIRSLIENLSSQMQDVSEAFAEDTTDILPAAAPEELL